MWYPGFMPNLAQACHYQQSPYPGYYEPQAPVQPPPSHTVPHIPVQQYHNPLDRQMGWDAAIADVVSDRVSSQIGSSSYAPVDLSGWQHVLTESEHTSGPVRAKRSRSRRILPPSTERVNAEAGPSTLPGPILPVNQPTTQPPGGSPETAANAASTQSNEEENKAPVSGLYRSRVLHESDWLSGVRSPRRLEHQRAKEKYARIASGCNVMRPSLRNGFKRKKASHVPRPFAMRLLVGGSSHPAK